MPFKSEKQRRYLWANEPEIARDWTDTYGSGIHKALGGRIGFYRGSDRHAGTSSSSKSYGPPGSASRASAPTHQPSNDRRSHTRTGPINVHADTAPVLQQQRQTDFRNLINQQNREKRDVFQRPGPKVGGGLGNWAANYAGANIGASLGLKLLGGLPGLILGTLFGSRTSRNLMNPRYRGATLQDRLRNIFTFSNDYIPDQRTEKGIETIDIRDKFNRIKPKPINKYEWDTVIDSPNYAKDYITLAGLTDKQKELLDQRKGMLGALGDQGILDTITSEDDPDDPATLEDVRKYYGIDI